MRSRTQIPLTEKLNKRWLAYAAAAAGVTMAFGPAAQAGTVYQYVGATVPVNGMLTENAIGLTLMNTANQKSFRIGTGFGSVRFFSGSAAMNAGGPIFVGGNGPVPLPFGARISNYLGGGFTGNGLMANVKGTNGSIINTYNYVQGLGWERNYEDRRRVFRTSRASGYWSGGGVGYLGFAFQAGSGVDYGWASLDIAEIRTIYGVTYDEVLTAYAYNTDGEPITAGEGAPEPGTLGLLALGSAALGLWRRRTAASAGA